jgi:hypothetical protein
MAAHSVVAPMLQSGIRTAAEMNATPESMGVSTAQYRGQDCASLKAQADALNLEKTNPRHEPLVAKALGWRVDAIHQVRAEQGCDKPGQARSAVASQVPMPGFPSPASASAPAQGAFRAKFDAVTPAFAQSLGLESPGGALVIETEKGSTAEKAGLRPLDVVTEVGGQTVQTPADLQAIVGRMRPGYKAAVRVWRQKAMRDMVVEVATPATTR